MPNSLPQDLSIVPRREWQTQTRDSIFHQHWTPRGHTFGACMSRPNTDWMYVNIPKNASSWTKPLLLEQKFEFYNYHSDKLYHKKALVVLRDPVDRWLSGIAEYFTLYYPHMAAGHFTPSVFDLVFDRVTFDDHTEKQVKFIQGLDTDHCTFMMCDDKYRQNFSNFVRERMGDNRYDRYEYQHVSDDSPERRQFKILLNEAMLDRPKYLEQIKNYFAADYRLIEQVKFYGR